MAVEPVATPVAGFPSVWRTVSFGTSCLGTGALLFLAGALALFSLILFNSQLRNEVIVDGMGRRSEIPAISVVGCLIVLFPAVMLILAGLSLFCVAPVESGARPLAAGATAAWCLCLMVTMQIPLSAIGIPLRPPVAEQGRLDRDPVRLIYGSNVGFALASSMLASTAGALAIAFVCAVAHRFHNLKLAASARRFLMYQIVVLPVLVFVFFLHFAAAEAWPTMSWYWLGLPAFLLTIALPTFGCVWFLRVLTELRRMLETAEQIAIEQAQTAEK